MPLWPGVWGSLKTPRSSGVNGEKSCILGFSWHLISLLKKMWFLLWLFSFSHNGFCVKLFCDDCHSRISDLP
jgi:hypothetical protein